MVTGETELAMAWDTGLIGNDHAVTMAAEAGFDALYVDLEHSAITADDAAARTGSYSRGSPSARAGTAAWDLRSR